MPNIKVWTTASVKNWFCWKHFPNKPWNQRTTCTGSLLESFSENLKFWWLSLWGYTDWEFAGKFLWKPQVLVALPLQGWGGQWGVFPVLWPSRTPCLPIYRLKQYNRHPGRGQNSRLSYRPQNKIFRYLRVALDTCKPCFLCGPCR